MKTILCTSILTAFFPLLPCLALDSPNGEQAAAIHAALQQFDSGIAPDHFDAAMADLDGNPPMDALALMNGKSGYCGSGGCTLFVLSASDNGLVNVGAVKVVNRPIYLRSTSHHRFRDLLVRVRGGGATPGFAVLAFDGKRYPAGPGETLAAVESTDKVLFAEPFEQTLELLGVTFQVASPNTPASNSVTITPAGLERDNRPETVNIDGIITGAEVADLNIDSSPEIYVYVRATDGTDAGSVVAYASNNQNSLSQIYLPDLAENKKNTVGYRGGDEFAVVETTFARRFRIYPNDDSITEPTGHFRQLQYKLMAGEAGWVLRLDKSLEY